MHLTICPKISAVNYESLSNGFVSKWICPYCMFVYPWSNRRNKYGTDTVRKLQWWYFAGLIYCFLAFLDQSIIQSQSFNARFSILYQWSEILSTIDRWVVPVNLSGEREKKLFSSCGCFRKLTSLTLPFNSFTWYILVSVSLSFWRELSCTRSKSQGQIILILKVTVKGNHQGQTKIRILSVEGLEMLGMKSFTLVTFFFWGGGGGGGVQSFI